ncbi:MAG TPA: EamA family transporter [Pyrinomonadaceae bacterium]|jgi:uncharacterized membrane protein|nr:EamA family transporter [Pyrinomonadaceae bacterium]
MNNFYFPFALATCGALLYHLSQRSIPRGMNPFLTTIIAYLVGIILCGLSLFIFPANKPLRDSLRESNWAVFAVGVAVVAIELGFVLAYRAGWRISVAAVATNASVTILLIPIGILVFKDQLSARNIIGLIFCLIGLILVAKD